MLQDPLFILAAIASLVVVAILIIGVGGFAREGEDNRKRSNRMMRYRIYAQGAAVAIIMVFVAVRGVGG